MMTQIAREFISYMAVVSCAFIADAIVSMIMYKEYTLNGIQLVAMTIMLVHCIRCYIKTVKGGMR